MLTIALSLTLNIAAQACPAAKVAAVTGDDHAFYQEKLAFQPLYAMHFPEWIGADLDEWADQPGGLSVSPANINQPYRRLVNAVILLRETPRGSSTWGNYVADRSANLDPASDCGGSGQVRATNWGLQHITITKASLLTDTAIERAGTLVHEACHSVLSCGHSPSSDCEAEASCDAIWSSHSAQTRGIQFMMAAMENHPSLLLGGNPNNPVWAIVRQRINSKLNSHFNVHPGFNVVTDPGFPTRFDTQSWTQSGDCCDVADFGDSMAGFNAITGVALSVDANNVDRMQVTRRRLGANGVWAGTFSRTFGRDEAESVDRLSAVPDNYVTTGLSTTFSYSGVTQLGLRARRLLPDGSLAAEQTFWSGSPTSNPEAHFGTSGSVFGMLGLGLKADFSQVDGFGFREQMLPWYTSKVGGSGGSSLMRRCGNNQLPVGITATEAPYGSGKTVGHFGIICGYTTDVDNGVLDAKTVINTSYFDVARQRYFAGGTRSWASYFNSQRPVGAKEVFCPAGFYVNGMITTSDDTLVRQILSLRCKRFSDGATSSPPVGVGSWGSVFTDHQCQTSNNPASVGFHARSGWLLDALSLRCGNTHVPPSNGAVLVGPAAAIPDASSAGVTSIIDVQGPGSVSSLKVTVFILHSARGDLQVSLQSPDGTVHALHSRTGGTEDHLIIQNLDVDTFDRRAIAGDWRLIVRDLQGANTGTLLGWSLDIN